MNRRRFLSALTASALCALGGTRLGSAAPTPAPQPSAPGPEKPGADIGTSDQAQPDKDQAQGAADKNAPDAKDKGASRDRPKGDGVKRLVTIFLRGGLDWLSAVPPVGLARYYGQRPAIALAPPGQPGGALPLAGDFGLHPALGPLLEFWKDGNLALVRGVGLPAPQRAHQDAQRAFESGLPLDRYPRDGWMGRLLPLLGAEAKALSLAPRPPLICQGKAAADNIAPQGFPRAGWPVERPEFFAALDHLYTGNGPLDKSYRQTQVVLRNKLSALERETKGSAGDAPSVHALPDLAGKIADYVEKKPATRLVFLGLGGVDSHTDQGAGKGRLAEALYSLGRGLAALAKALGPRLDDTVVLVISEFGRSLAENDYGGTENGYGGMAMVLGGKAAGGRLHGDWPGLDPEKLTDESDLAVTVDSREVVAEICLNHFGLPREGLSRVLPGYFPTSSLKDLFPKA